MLRRKEKKENILILKGRHVNLREISPKDAEALTYYTDDNDITQFTPLVAPYQKDEALKYIERSALHIDQEIEFVLAVALKKTDEMVGTMTLNNIDYKNRTAEVRFWIGKEHRRNGYFRDAADLILDFAYKELHLNKIYARVTEPNKVSKKALERYGFVYEGLLRESLWKNNQFYNEYIYSILKDEFLDKEFND